MWTTPVQRAANPRYLTGPDGRATFFLGYGWVNLPAVPAGQRGYPPGWRGQMFSYREYLWQDESNAATPGMVAARVQQALDQYAAHGVNLSRVWVHWRLGAKPGAGTGPGDVGEEAYLWPATPFGRGRRQRPDGWPMADLDTFDPVFWDCLFNYADACAARDILVELVLWFREWGGGPAGTFAEGDFHPDHNEQGVDGRDLTDIFADTENSRRLRHYQEYPYTGCSKVSGAQHTVGVARDVQHGRATWGRWVPPAAGGPLAGAAPGGASRPRGAGGRSGGRAGGERGAGRRGPRPPGAAGPALVALVVPAVE